MLTCYKYSCFENSRDFLHCMENIHKHWFYKSIFIIQILIAQYATLTLIKLYVHNTLQYALS